MIYLRAHHLVCFQHFEGKGYSDEFVANLSSILNSLKANPDCKNVTILDRCDDVCRSCPNKQNGKCVNENYVKSLDGQFLAVLQFSVNDVISFSQAIDHINKFLYGQQFVKICSSCQWYNICSKYRKI